MTQDPDALVAMTRILSPHCRVTRLPSGALIADWKRTRFLGMTAADVERFAAESSEERAELVTGLVRAGCARARRQAAHLRPHPARPGPRLPAPVPDDTP
ncbi:hypothetical protein ACWDE9_44640, partial [Streptomyces olivaceoviridis]